MGCQSEEESEDGKRESLFIQKCMEGTRFDGGLTSPYSLSVLDIECGMPRTGLGPEKIEDLGLQKEEIGLKQHVILTDCLSPPRSNSGPVEVNISPTSMERCKEACLKLRLKGAHQVGGECNKNKIIHEKCKECEWIQNRVRNREDTQKEKSLNNNSLEKEKWETRATFNPQTAPVDIEVEYYVEYPPEESDKEGNKLREEEELTLITNVQKSLSLKRARLTFEDEGSKGEEVQADKKLKTSTQQMVLLREKPTQQLTTGNAMAEEAGLPMPHPPK